MKKSLFILICGFLICAATMKVQAQNVDYEKYYREFKVESRNGKYGLLFRNETVVPFEYDAIVAQRDNRGFISKRGEKYGIITAGITNYIQTSGTDINSRHEWNFIIEKGVGGKDIDLRMVASVIPPEFDKIDYVDGKYWVGKGKQKGIFNSLGGTILRCEFDEIKFVDGKYLVSKGKQKGIFNSLGGTILRLDDYDEITFTDGKYLVSKGKQKGIFNSLGGTILRCEFDEIKLVDGKYWVSKGNKKGIFNSLGGTILRCEFDKIELISDGKYFAYKDGKKSLYNSMGGRLQTDFDVVYSTD